MSPDLAEAHSRTALLLGEDAVRRLSAAHVLLVGVGGVGSYAAEMLARTGVGHVTLIDADEVAPSNLNRQLPALHSTLGQPKVEVMARRMTDINPAMRVDPVKEFVTPDSVASVLAGCGPLDFVLDAIDSLAPKIELIDACCKSHIRIICSMGAGGRLDPCKVRYADISDTYHDPLAREVRKRLRARGVTKGVRVVFSTEQPRRNALLMSDDMPFKRSAFGTVAWVPALFGMMMAAYAVDRIAGTVSSPLL